MKTVAQDLFTRALELPEPERAAFLAEACGGDAELRLEVQRLLVDAARADSFFGDGDGATLGAEEFKETYSEKAGDVIGPYKLREQIGEGGFGSVWVADQEKPVRRRVALKLVKAGMDTKQVIARFEQERQALAMMDHPNIAKVFDAGTSAQGRPYFVMELVRGVTITDYCDEKALDTQQRLDLFILVCQAVQHAHQKGIIHRDLKPSNILVTVNDGRPVPKVIDFGVAKATQGRLVEQTIYTQLQQMIGTPPHRARESSRTLCGDLDWIVMKCLEKDRMRRYETANGLAMDFQQHLLELGRAAEALVHLEKAFQWVKIKVEMAPNDARAARDWSACLSSIGTSQIALGRVEEGAKNLEEAVRHAEQLAARDPENGSFHRTFLESLLAQSGGFATQAKHPGISLR